MISRAGARGKGGGGRLSGQLHVVVSECGGLTPCRQLRPSSRRE